MDITQDFQLPIDWDKESKWGNQKWWNKKLKQFPEEGRRILIEDICHRVLLWQQTQQGTHTIKEEISGMILDFHLSKSGFKEHSNGFCENRKTQETYNQNFRKEIIESKVNFSSFLPQKQKNPHDLSFPFESKKQLSSSKKKESGLMDPYHDSLMDEVMERVVAFRIGSGFIRQMGTTVKCKAKSFCLSNKKIKKVCRITARFTEFAAKKIKIFAERAITAKRSQNFVKNILSAKAFKLSSQLIALGIPEKMMHHYLQSAYKLAVTRIPFLKLCAVFPKARDAFRLFLKSESGAIRIPQITTNMSKKEMIKKLKKVGYEVVSGGKGGHTKMKKKGCETITLPTKISPGISAKYTKLLSKLCNKS